MPVFGSRFFQPRSTDFRLSGVVCGVPAGRGKVGNSTDSGYPQDLVVYPTTEDDVLDLKSGTCCSFASFVVSALALLSFLF